MIVRQNRFVDNFTANRKLSIVLWATLHEKHTYGNIAPKHQFIGQLSLNVSVKHPSNAHPPKWFTLFINKDG